VQKTRLILDTNIVSRAMSKHSQAVYLEEMNVLLPRHQFCITLFTQYELLKSSSRANQRLILEYLSENYTRIELNEETVNFASRIFNLYKKHDSTKGYKITDGDIINGAITIGLNCCIMTIDNNDYPRPFFKEVSRHSLTYDSSTGRPTMDMAYILCPDMEYLKYCAKELDV
jgi:predicted nucleic acid-binding protein